MAVPFYWKYTGQQETDRIIDAFEQEVEESQEDEQKEENDKKDEQATPSKEDAAILAEGTTIGIIQIEKIDLKFPIMEGTVAKVLNSGIGHITETAAIGTNGNCVLCGHHGSRYGTFFNRLTELAKGDEVEILDKEGNIHTYEVVDMFTTHPYDNSIKTQNDSEELTLFTCASKGTMRYVVKCVAKQEGGGTNDRTD